MRLSPAAVRGMVNVELKEEELKIGDSELYNMRSVPKYIPFLIHRKVLAYLPSLKPSSVHSHITPHAVPCYA